MSLTDYGAFVELEPGIEGLIHVSEMSWTKKIKHPSKMLEVGQDIECQVLEVDSHAKRISLGLKQLEPDPWSLFTDKYKPGDKITGKVRSLTDYGVFIGIEEGVDGMVHKTDLSWTVKINNPGDLYSKGDEVEAIILSINHDDKKVSLGVKQLFDDPWAEIAERYKPGTVVEGATVLNLADYGVFVRIKEGIEALVPSGEIPPGMELKSGEKVRAEVNNLDVVDRRITLSMRDVGATPAAEQLEVMKRESAGKGATLGDLFKGKLGGKLQSIAGAAGADGKDESSSVAAAPDESAQDDGSAEQDESAEEDESEDD
jgi:small subunit ribosomal protein S1